MSLTELHEEIDRSFGDGPAPRPVEDRIRVGRKALMRRRVTSGVAALGVAVALAGTAWALAPGDGPAAHGTTIATDPTVSPSVDPAPLSSEPWEGEPVRYADGELQIWPGAVVHEHLENPYGYQPPKLSDALDLTVDGRRVWVIARYRNGGFGLMSSEPSRGWASFDAFVTDQVQADEHRQLAAAMDAAGVSGWPDALRLTDQGTVVASRGSEILQRTDNPQLGGSFAPAGTPTGAALVRAAEDQVAYFVVWRVIDGGLDVITTPPDDVTGATFPELLSYARSQYASGEGLR